MIRKEKWNFSNELDKKFEESTNRFNDRSANYSSQNDGNEKNKFYDNGVSNNKYNSNLQSKSENIFSFDNLLKKTSIFKDSKESSERIIQGLPNITKNNRDNLYKLNAIESYANKIDDKELSKEANKNYIDLICENAFDRDYKMPKKLDNFSFDGIIKGVTKVGEGVKKYIDNWWDQYRNDEGNIQLFNATNSNTSNVKLDDKKSINITIGSIESEIETGINKVVGGLDGTTKGLLNIDGSFEASDGRLNIGLSKEGAGLGTDIRLSNLKNGELEYTISKSHAIPIFKSNDQIKLSKTMGLNNKGLAIGAEISIQNENGIYETFRIRGNTYYKTLVAI